MKSSGTRRIRASVLLLLISTLKAAPGTSVAFPTLKHLSQELVRVRYEVKQVERKEMAPSFLIILSVGLASILCVWPLIVLVPFLRSYTGSIHAYRDPQTV